MTGESASIDAVESQAVASWTPFAMTAFGLMFSLPFLVPYHQLPIPSFQSEWLAMLLGLLGLIALLLQKKGILLHVPRIALAPALLISVVALQIAADMFAYRASAFTISMYLWWCVLLAVAGRTLMQAAGEQRLASCLAWCLLSGGIANAAFGILQYLQIWQMLGGLVSEPMPVALSGVYGNLAQQNHFSTHLALAFASATYLRFSGRLTIRWYGATGILLLAALILSASRSSFLYVAWIAVLSIRLARTGIKHRDGKRMAWWALGISTAVILGLYLALRHSPMIPQIERLLTLTGGLGPRVYLWKHAFVMFANQPLLGVGFDSFAYHLVGQLQQLNEPIVWGIDQYAHNLGLQLLAVSGLCGFVAVAGPGVLFLRRQMRTKYTLERFWSWGVLGILLIHSAFEQPLYYAYFLGIAAFVAGMSDPSAWNIRLGGIPKALTTFLLASALLFLVKTANDYRNIEAYSRGEKFLGSTEEHQTDARAQVILNLHAYSIFVPLSELLSPSDVVPANAPAAQKIELNRRMMRYAPTAEIEFRHAALLAQAGRIPEAIKQYDRAARAYPIETEQYLKRFNALAAGDAATYGQLAAYANERSLKPVTQYKAP